jgi:hypothetical protein
MLGTRKGIVVEWKFATTYYPVAEKYSEIESGKLSACIWGK